MKKAIAVAVLFGGLFIGTSFAGEVHCPLHPYSSCYDTFKTAPSGAHLWKCTCGDTVWVG